MKTRVHGADSLYTDMADIYVGTCSWKYDSWRGIVYPEIGEFDHLEEYAKYFSTVEVDQ